MRRNWQKAKVQKEVKVFLANEKIKEEEVFLIDENGDIVGKTETAEALSRAKDLDLDLVIVNPKANPPVAKIVDLGQLKYEYDKKMHKQKVLQKKVETKNVKITFRIGKHDLDIRIEQAKKFLTNDDKVKIELFLRGRERQHFDKAKELIESFVNNVKNDPNLNVFDDQPLTRQPSGFSIILSNKK